MQLGLISDIHGNQPALEAVLSDMPLADLDGLVCAGDVVGYNPWPAECVDALRERDVPTVMGNHDRAVASETEFRFNDAASAGVSYAREQLNDVQRGWLSRLPTELTLHDDRVRVVHGHPDDPDRYTYPRMFSPDLLAGEDALVLGHTHVQAHEVFEEGVVVNPGSVGQPRDRNPKAAYAILDLDAGTVEERRVSYDIERVKRAIEEAGLPRELGTRLEQGR